MDKGIDINYTSPYDIQSLGLKTKINSGYTALHIVMTTYGKNSNQ